METSDGVHSLAKLLALRPPRLPGPREIGLKLLAYNDVRLAPSAQRSAKRGGLGYFTEVVHADAKVLCSKRQELRSIDRQTGADIKEKKGLHDMKVLITGRAANVEKALPLVEQLLSLEDMEQREDWQQEEPSLSWWPRAWDTEGRSSGAAASQLDRDNAGGLGFCTEVLTADAKVLCSKRQELRNIERQTGADIKEKRGLQDMKVLITGSAAHVEKAMPLVEQLLGLQDMEQREEWQAEEPSSWWGGGAREAEMRSSGPAASQPQPQAWETDMGERQPPTSNWGNWWDGDNAGSKQPAWPSAADDDSWDVPSPEPPPPPFPSPPGLPLPDEQDQAQWEPPVPHQEAQQERSAAPQDHSARTAKRAAAKASVYIPDLGDGLQDASFLPPEPLGAAPPPNRWRRNDRMGNKVLQTVFPPRRAAGYNGVVVPPPPPLPAARDFDDDTTLPRVEVEATGSRFRCDRSDDGAPPVRSAPNPLAAAPKPKAATLAFLFGGRDDDEDDPLPKAKAALAVPIPKPQAPPCRRRNEQGATHSPEAAVRKFWTAFKLCYTEFVEETADVDWSQMTPDTAARLQRLEAWARSFADWARDEDHGASESRF